MGHYRFNTLADPNPTTFTQVSDVFANGGIVEVNNQGYQPTNFTETVDGKITPFDGNVTLADGWQGYGTLINQSGERVGIAYDTNDYSQGERMWTMVNGQASLTTFDDNPRSLSDTGYVTGAKNDLSVGFLLTPSGSHTTFTIPGALYMDPTGVSTNGIVVGNYYVPAASGLGRDIKGFERTPDGQIKTLTVLAPEAANAPFPGTATVNAVNASGWIVGTFSDGVQQHGFLIDPKGQETQLDAPNAYNTYINTINDEGEIGGFYTNPGDTSAGHGFIADSPKAPIGPGTTLGDDNDHMLGKVVLKLS